MFAFRQILKISQICFSVIAISSFNLQSKSRKGSKMTWFALFLRVQNEAVEIEASYFLVRWRFRRLMQHGDLLSKVLQVNFSCTFDQFIIEDALIENIVTFIKHKWRTKGWQSWSQAVTYPIRLIIAKTALFITLLRYFQRLRYFWRSHEHIWLGISNSFPFITLNWMIRLDGAFVIHFCMVNFIPQISYSVLNVLSINLFVNKHC